MQPSTTVSKSQRVIKFRVWDNRRKEWIHGPGNEVNLFGECILLGEFLVRPDDTHVKLEDLNNMVALQFTGLLDKNKKEIYEGDICQWEEHGQLHTGHMFYNKDAAAFRIQMKQGYFPDFKLLAHHVEVIGNIYQNPELLNP